MLQSYSYGCINQPTSLGPHLVIAFCPSWMVNPLFFIEKPCCHLPGTKLSRLKWKLAWGKSHVARRLTCTATTGVRIPILSLYICIYIYVYIYIHIYIYIYGGFLKWGYPQIMHFNRIFHYKPSILGTPIYGNPHIVIFTCINIYQHIILNMNWSKPGTLVKPIFLLGGGFLFTPNIGFQRFDPSP